MVHSDFVLDDNGPFCDRSSRDFFRIVSRLAFSRMMVPFDFFRKGDIYWVRSGLKKRKRMVRYQDEDEREKISWREIDRRKDRSPYAPKETPQDRQRSRRSEWVMKKYRKEADKLFMGKKGTKKHQKALSDIDRYQGTDQFEAVAKAYLDQYGLPEDWSTLSLLLDYSDPEKVIEALTAMKNLYEGRTPVEKQGFRAKVDIFAMTANDRDLRDFAEEMLKTL